MRRIHFWTLVLLAACAHAPAVSSDDLPLRRVVIYRNGVGYFERAGKVHSDRVRFQVRPGDLGDFLATLAVVERGGSSVRSAAFPIHKEPKGGDGLDTVTLDLAGDEHNLAVGYVVEQPVWRPSYRLVLGREGPVLQAWGIVQNLSGADWNDVSLSLVAGAPIAFRATLSTPSTPQRPVVSDTGELISSVPVGESTLAQRAPATAPAPSLAPGIGGATAPAPSMAPSTRSRAVAKPRGYSAEPPAAMDTGVVEEMPRNLSILAAASVQAGATRYDLPRPVTVPNESQTMVLLLAQPVPGEVVFLFAPDPGIPDSARHPFRVARFTNATSGLLERGPIAVFESGAFLGQGLLEPLSAGGEATVPFALERGIAVDRDQKGDQREARLAHIEAGSLTLDRDEVLKTTYRLRNGSDREIKVVVKHQRAYGMRLFQPPAGTGDQVGRGHALVPVSVVAQATAELAVDERRAHRVSADWLGPEADAAVKAYLADARADARITQTLRQAWALRESLLKDVQGRDKLQGERGILQNASSEARQNLKALEKSKGKEVDTLRQRLAARLGELDTKLDAANKRLVELDLRINDQRPRFFEIVRAIKLDEPLPPADDKPKA